MYVQSVYECNKYIKYIAQCKFISRQKMSDLCSSSQEELIMLQEELKKSQEIDPSLLQKQHEKGYFYKLKL